MINSHIKEAKNLYFKNVALKSSLAAIYGVFVIVILVGAYFVPVTLLITIPFIFMPFTLGFIAANSSLNIGLKNPYLLMFVFFGKYFKDLMFGCFRSLFGLLKAVVVYTAYSLICSIVIVSVLNSTSPEFASIITEMDNATSIEALNELILKMETVPEFVIGQYINFTISFGFAAYAFLHHIITNSVKYSFLFSSNHPFNFREVNYIHRVAFKKYRKEFYFNYYSIAVFVALLFIGGYVGGSLLAYFKFGSDVLQAAIVGLFGGFVLNLFILPFLLDVIEVTFRHNKAFYAASLIEIATNAFNELQKTNQLSEEELKKAEEALKETQKNFEEVQKSEQDKEDENKKQ